MAHFPLKAERHEGGRDQPPGPDTFGIFDDRGYWANLGGVTFQVPVALPNSEIIADHVTRMCNAAYKQGKADAQETMREALGLAGVRVRQL